MRGARSLAGDGPTPPRPLPRGLPPQRPLRLGPEWRSGPRPGPDRLQGAGQSLRPLSRPSPFCTGQQMRTRGRFLFFFNHTICWASSVCRAPCQAPRFG